MEQIQAVKEILSFPKDIVLTSHRNPDGDALGSTLGLMQYLKQLGHNVQVIYPSDYPNIYNWMPGVEDAVIYDLDPEKATALIKAAQVIFILDYNSLDRVDKMGEMISYAKCPKIMIDHHLDPEPCADFIFSDTTSSSTSEMVYDFITALGDRHRIIPLVGENLYVGIVTDTGSFKFSTSPKVFRVVADLVDLGVNDVKLQDLIFNCQYEKHLRLLGHCLYNRMEILPEFNTGIIWLTKKDYESFDIQRGDTEGIVNYLLTLKNIRMAAFITEQPNIVKISLRSKGDFSVQEVCRDHFRGGGHKNASGGFSHGNLNSVLIKFKNLLPLYKDKLVSTDNELHIQNLN